MKKQRTTPKNPNPSPQRSDRSMLCTVLGLQEDASDTQIQVAYAAEMHRKKFLCDAPGRRCTGPSEELKQMLKDKEQFMVSHPTRDIHKALVLLNRAEQQLAPTHPFMAELIAHTSTFTIKDNTVRWLKTFDLLYEVFRVASGNLQQDIYEFMTL